MIRLHFTVEGQTEEQFVKQMLIPHLAHFNIFGDVRCVLTSEDKKHSVRYRGGFRRTKAAYEIVKRDILNWMKEDYHSSCRFTTMFDLYALPDSFPHPDCLPSDPYMRVDALESAFKIDIDDAMNEVVRWLIL